MKKKAFTLVELIVVITILAILWTIAFISLSWYSKEARDSKRITDTSGLLSKINIEEVRWNTLDKLITNTRTATGQILWKTGSTFQTFWKANFKTLKEDEKNFEDPFKKWQHYPVAYTVWGNWKDAYKFVQIANVSEKENRNIIKWNYYTLSEQDNPSLFYSGSFYTEKPDSDLVYDLNWVVPKEPEPENPEPEPTFWCAEKPKYTNAIFTEWIVTWYDVIWQNTDENAACYYECEWKCMENADISDCNSSWDLLFSKEKYWNCDTNDIIVCSWKSTWYQLAACNVWASQASDWKVCNNAATCNAVWTDRLWAILQWGRNKAFPYNYNTIHKARIAWNIWLDKNHTIDTYGLIWGDAVKIPGTNYWTWATDNIDDNWWWKSNDVIKMQWPCLDGYRIPKQKEWEKIHLSGKWWNDWKKLSEDLMIPPNWYRRDIDGERFYQWKNWYVWASDTESFEKTYLFSFSYIFIANKDITSRSTGAWIRCFKN